MKEIFDIARFSQLFSYRLIFISRDFFWPLLAQIDWIYSKILRVSFAANTMSYTYWIPYIFSSTKIYASIFSMENNKLFSRQKIWEYLQIKKYSE